MKLSKLLKIAIVLILLLENKFLYLISFPSSIEQLNNAHQKIIIISIVIFTILLFGYRLFSQKHLIFGVIVLVFGGIYIIELLVSYTIHDQGIVNAFVSSNYYLMPLGYFIYSYYFRKSNELESFKEIVINFTIILCILFTLQYILINFNIKFLNIDFEQMRFGRLRIYEAGNYFINLGILFSFSYILENKGSIKKVWKYILAVLLGLYSIVFISKGRIGLIIIIISMIGMVTYKYRKKIKKLIIATIAISIIILGFLRTDIAQTYIQQSKTIDASVTNRTNAINMYINQIKSNPIFGMGFIRDMDGSESTFLLRGPRGTYTRTDVGLIGFTNCFGIVGLVWYITFIYIILLYMYRIRNVFKLDGYLDLIGIFIMIILSSGSLIIMDASRIFLVPIFTAMIDYLYYKNNIIKDI